MDISILEDITLSKPVTIEGYPSNINLEFINSNTQLKITVTDFDGTPRSDVDFNYVINEYPDYNGIEIIEHKGDRCNLGYSGNDDFFEFSNFEFILEKNHSFYMTTDGFIDISYGKKGFSLGKKKFKTMLLENCQKSMKEQGKALEDFFMNDNLSEKIEQRDDISVMGFKI